ncbi:hypothetical protein MC885_005072, partial [Smutsia gigantea]
GRRSQRNEARSCSPLQVLSPREAPNARAAVAAAAGRATAGKPEPRGAARSWVRCRALIALPLLRGSRPRALSQEDPPCPAQPRGPGLLHRGGEPDPGRLLRGEAEWVPALTPQSSGQAPLRLQTLGAARLRSGRAPDPATETSAWLPVWEQAFALRPGICGRTKRRSLHWRACATGWAGGAAGGGGSSGAAWGASVETCQELGGRQSVLAPRGTAR